jgi:hypothetical protein
MQAANPASSIQTIDVTDPIGTKVHVTNSVFTNVRDMHISQGETDIQFSTFINLASPADCTGDTTPGDHGKRIYSNNLFVNTMNKDNAAGSTCFYHYNLMVPQIADVPNSDHLIVLPSVELANPRLKDIAGGDFHVLAGSPAIDAADPAATLDHDLDGHKRPEGPRRDLGAFEFTP